MPSQIAPPSGLSNLDVLVKMNNMRYIYSLPTSISFDGKGLFGYTFGPLNQKDVDIYYIEVEKGHDTFMISKKITRTYYILCGNGYSLREPEIRRRPGYACRSPTESGIFLFRKDETCRVCEAALVSRE